MRNEYPPPFIHEELKAGPYSLSGSIKRLYTVAIDTIGYVHE